MNLDLQPFALERYFAQYEFALKHNLSASDCEPKSVAELFALSQRSLSELHELKLGYTEPRGSHSLRQRIASLCDDTEADDVIIAAPQELITLTLGALCASGGPVVVLTPAYQSLHEIVRAEGADVRRWEVRETKSGFDLDMDSLNELLIGAQGLVVNFPHNPTGYLPNQATFDEIALRCERAGAWIFSDEMYRGLEPDEERLVMASSRYKNATSLSGLSKSYGLAGLRLGYITTKDKALQKEVLKRKDYTTICAPGPSEVIADVAFENRERLWSEHRRRIERNTKALASFVHDHDVFEWRKPGGPLAYLKTTQRAEEICAEARKASVLLLPSYVFDEDDPFHIRFGLGRDDFQEGLRALGEALA